MIKRPRIKLIERIIYSEKLGQTKEPKLEGEHELHELHE